MLERKSIKELYLLVWSKALLFEASCCFSHINWLVTFCSFKSEYIATLLFSDCSPSGVILPKIQNALHIWNSTPWVLSDRNQKWTLYFIFGDWHSIIVAVPKGTVKGFAHVPTHVVYGGGIVGPRTFESSGGNVL